MIKFEIKGLTKTFSSLLCPICDKNLEPHYHHNQPEPSYYYCKDDLSPYANTPHYKYFNDDGYGYEIFLIWNNVAVGSLYSLKRNFEHDNYTKIELTYHVKKNFNQSQKAVTRTFSPDEFEINPKNINELKDKIERFIEIAEVFE